MALLFCCCCFSELMSRTLRKCPDVTLFFLQKAAVRRCCLERCISATLQEKNLFQPFPLVFISFFFVFYSFTLGFGHTEGCRSSPKGPMRAEKAQMGQQTARSLQGRWQKVQFVQKPIYVLP